MGEQKQRVGSRHGLDEIVGGRELWRSLGYPSAGAWRAALRRGTVPIRVFDVPNRKSKFAYVRDVAIWLSVIGRAGAHKPAKVNPRPRPLAAGADVKGAKGRPSAG